MTKSLKYLLISNILFVCNFSIAQRENDFVKPHGSHVSEYMTISAGTLGPNALPVPEIRSGCIGTEMEFETATRTHWIPGDRSVDLFLRLYYPIARNLIAVEFYGIAAEYFHCTNEVRDQRQIYYDDQGWTLEGGDLYCATHLQIVRNQTFFPNISAQYAFKTTTGNLNNGRYTDTPAQIINIYFGKRFAFRNLWISEISYSGMIGLYIWQTNRYEVSQDEGPLLGLENEIKIKNFAVRNALAGYFGYETTVPNKDFNRYEDTPDQPVVYRGELRKYGKTVNWTLRYEHGFKDYPYQTISVSATWHFPTKNKVIKIQQEESN